MCDSNKDTPPPERLPKNGRQVGAENVERLRKYIDDLKSKGLRLPSRKGKPDKSAIAITAGFNRLTLYNNPEAIALLDKAVAELGLEGNATSPNRRTEHLQHQVSKRERRIQRLEELLTTKVAENEMLRREKKELEEKLRQYSVYEDVMSSTGRRYRP